MRHKKALVIGGTKGIGLETARQLVSQGHKVTTIGRSDKKAAGVRHLRGDISDSSNLNQLLKRISLEGTLDYVFCIAGGTEPKNINSFHEEDFRRANSINFLYVVQTFRTLRKNLETSSNPLFVAIGSRWSYRYDLAEALPYICAKHSLRFFIDHLSSSNLHLSIRHYTVPVTLTLGYRGVKQGMQKLNLGKLTILEPYKLAKSKEVARSLLNHSVNKMGKGSIFTINPDYCVVEG